MGVSDLGSVNEVSGGRKARQTGTHGDGRTMLSAPWSTQSGVARSLQALAQRRVLADPAQKDDRRLGEVDLLLVHPVDVADRPAQRADGLDRRASG